MSVEDALSLLEEHDVKFADLRFTDTKGKEIGRASCWERV